jgi:hypothetical protein
MENFKTKSLKALILSSLCMGYLTAHAGASSLQKVCGFATDDRKTLSKPEVDLLAKRLDLIKKDLTEFCKKPEFLVNVGPLSMFRVGDTRSQWQHQRRYEFSQSQYRYQTSDRNYG